MKTRSDQDRRADIVMNDLLNAKTIETLEKENARLEELLANAEARVKELEASEHLLQLICEKYPEQAKELRQQLQQIKG